MKHLDRAVTAFVYIFLYAPILVMMFFSFNASNSTSLFAGFSTKWYAELFARRDVMNALKNTLILAVSSSLIATVLGTVAAVGVYNLRRRWTKNVLLTVNNLPMMNPDIVTGVSLMLLFVFVGRLLGAKESVGFVTLLIAHITFNVPYVLLNVLPKLRQTDRQLVEAAMDLGCTPVRAFFKVVLPAIFPGIASGAVMAFTLSLDDFVISNFTAGKFQTLPLFLYSMTKKRVKPDMFALSTIVFVVILVLLLTSNLLQIRAEKKQKGVRK